MPAILFPQIDPVAVSLGGLEIRWYSLAYIAGIMLGLYIAKRLARRTSPALDAQHFDNLLTYIVLGVILGGRLGFVLFYHPGYFIEHPLDIFKVWQGGMSFHGGLLGVIAAVFMYKNKHNLKFFALMDVIACVTPVGLMLGRLANFINGELYGRATTMAWGMVFPGGGDFPRHPSQIYEALLEGLLLFIVMYFAAVKLRILERLGAASGLFLCGYSLARIFCEFFRQPDAHIGFLSGGFTYGQLLSLPMFGLGILLLKRSRPATA